MAGKSPSGIDKMPRVGTAVVLLFVSIVAVAASSAVQQPADFSGHWVLASVTPARTNYDEFWLGSEATVTQDATGLTITRISPPRREAKFKFKAESHNEFDGNGQRLIRDSRATLSGATLLISTDTTSADGQRWLSNISRWSLDAEGHLVVGDTEICGKGECPSVVTTLRYLRKGFRVQGAGFRVR